MFIQKASSTLYNYFSPPPQTLIEYSKSHYKFAALPKEVQHTIEKASNTLFINEPNKKALVIDPDYKFSHLSKQSLIQFYEILSNYCAQGETNSPFFVHLFDIEDHIFRQVLAEPKTAGEEYKKLLRENSPLTDKINNLQTNGSRFYDLEPKSKHATTLTDFQIAKHETKHSPNPLKPLKILKITAENSRNRSGGIASVIIGLATAHKELRNLDPSSSKVYSFSLVYEKDKHALRNFTFQGLVTHPYEGQIVKSSIYKNKKNLEYLVQPDPSFPRIFNTPTTKPVSSEGAQDRMLYVGAAAAAFAALYKGKTADRQIEVLQCENLGIIGSAFPLLKEVYKPIRKAFGLKSIARTIAVWHHGNVGYGPKCDPKRLEIMGIKMKKRHTSPIDLVGVGIPYADKVLHVSKETAQRALDPDPEIHKGRRHLLLRPGKVISITNGVETYKFDPTNKKIFKSLALERTFDAKGVETTDYISYRNKLKKLLHRANILKSPDLPLVLFIGRYVEEKGINTLVDVIKTAPQTIQLACMGHGTPTKALDQLIKMASTTHRNQLKMLTQLEEQNISFSSFGKDYNVPVGLLLRAAADFFIIPSYVEACPLLPMESLCSGGLLITPFHQGFKEICKPEGYPGPDGKIYSLKNEANAVCYQDPFNSSQASEALLKATEIMKNKTLEERNQLAIRLRNQATENYGWYNLDIPSQTLAGGAISYDCLYHDLAGRARPTISEISLGSTSLPISRKPAIISIPAYAKNILTFRLF
jgi:starch synthase